LKKKVKLFVFLTHKHLRIDGHILQPAVPDRHISSSKVRLYDKMPTAAVLLAEGAEEMETVISVDVMRRGGVWLSLNCIFSIIMIIRK
jgi:hypothetical protein